MKTQIINSKREFKKSPKKYCSVIIFDFQKPLRKIKFKNSEYVLYSCMFFECDDKKIDVGNHVLELPSKTAWLQLYSFLDNNNKLNEKNLPLGICKHNNQHYSFTFDYNLRTLNSKLLTTTIRQSAEHKKEHNLEQKEEQIVEHVEEETIE